MNKSVLSAALFVCVFTMGDLVNVGDAAAGKPFTERSSWGSDRGLHLITLYDCSGCSKGGHCPKACHTAPRPGPTQANQSAVMHWPFKSDYKYKAEVKFFSQSRNAVWPSGGKVYAFNDYGQYTVQLKCNVGEKICYGAWPTGTNATTYWGVGRDGKQGCSDCCRTCASEQVAPTVLGN